ncbi:MAG: ribonuclease P protein component [Gammaproteobacteria bacterium]|nr:ribonuclease P protein component [Gammaproteobacteria bacterium]
MNLEHSRYQKHNRLKTPTEFRSVFNTGKRSIDSQFVVLVKQNNLGYSRLGLVISKKKLTRAVQRNLLKRLVRESFRGNAIIKRGYDIVVLPQKSVSINQKSILRDSLSSHWKKFT